MRCSLHVLFISVLLNFYITVTLIDCECWWHCSCTMEHDGVGDTEVDVYHLSDNDLAQKLRQMGANIGPITGSYRFSKYHIGVPVCSW